jgi:hypothetical protein
VSLNRVALEVVIEGIEALFELSFGEQLLWSE